MYKDLDNMICVTDSIGNSGEKIKNNSFEEFKKSLDNIKNMIKNEDINDGCGLIGNSLMLKQGFGTPISTTHVIEHDGMRLKGITTPVDISTFGLKGKTINLIHDDIDIDLHEKLREKFLERINEINSCSGQVADDSLAKYRLGYNHIKMPCMRKEAIKQLEEDEVKRQLDKLNEIVPLDLSKPKMVNKNTGDTYIWGGEMNSGKQASKSLRSMFEKIDDEESVDRFVETMKSLKEIESLDKTLERINNLKKDVKEIEKRKSKSWNKDRFYK